MLCLVFAVDDLTGAAEPVAAFTRKAEALARTPFDLATAPLMRVALARLGSSSHGLAVVLHHIIADGWSLPILVGELMAFYGSARQGRQTSLSPLRLQYADYAVWHRTLVETGGAEAQRTYWLRALAEPAPPLDLPVDGQRPAERTFHGADVRHRLEADLTSGVRALARARGASLFTTLLACVKVLLSRYSGQKDLIVGTPVAGRVRPELADQIGFYVNMLPLRTKIDRGEPFSVLLDRVARTTGEALEHEVYPFDQLVHELHLDRDLGRSPLFDVVLVVEKAAAALRFEGLEVRRLDLPRESSKFDLTFHFVELDDHLELTIEYRTDLFHRDRIAGLGRHLEQVIRAAVENPDGAVCRMPLLPAEERARVLAWGAAKSPLLWEQSVVGLFEAQVRRRADATAVTCGAEQLTYAGLNARANRLARRLAARGVGAETRIGVCVDRSLDLVVAILGILKAGGAYVPLDPSYPDERLRLLIADSGLAIVVTQGAEAARLQSWSGAVLDIADRECADERGEDLAHAGSQGTQVHPDHAAYVIYTSGSTGQPKGCVVTHGNLARLMTATDACYRFDERDVWTLFHSYAFDFSVWELWGALAYGGRLVVVPFWVSRAPDAFLDLLVESASRC